MVFWLQGVVESAPLSVMEYDVLVIGGGPAGIGAAVAAGRMGSKVALLERHDVLGGMGTAALVNNFCPAHLDGERLIIGGVFAEIREELIKRKAIFASQGCGYAMEPYNPQVYAELVEELVRAAGVDILFCSRIQQSSVTSAGKFRFIFENGTACAGRALIDATGDATFATALGAAFSFGRTADQAVMPLTYCYKIGPIDLEELRRKMPHLIRHDEPTNQPFLCLSGAREEVAMAQANGDLSIPRDHVASIMNIPGEPENATVNFGRVFIKDPTDPAQLAEAEETGKRQIEEGMAFFRKYLPGFEQTQVIERARQIGVRESRQIKGLYTLTGEDVLKCRQFEDVIAQCCYAVDIHSPESATTNMIELARGTHFDIPLRCLIPLDGPDNLLVAGRSISATQEAMSSFRVSPSAMAIGEAAGVTAAIAVRTDSRVKDVPAAMVQQRLLETGGTLS
jgi:hypothetical protein